MSSPSVLECFSACGVRGGRRALLLHGMFGSRLDMLPLAAALGSDGWEAFCFDLPAHGDEGMLNTVAPQPSFTPLSSLGRSDPQNGAYQESATPPQPSESAAGPVGHHGRGWVLRALLRTLEEMVRPGERLCLVGYSLGARLALLAARERPDLVAAVVAISGNPGIEDAAEVRSRAEQDRATAGLLRSFASSEDGIGRFRTWLSDKWYKASMWGVAHPLSLDPSFPQILARRVHGARLDALAAVLEDASLASQPHLWEWLAHSPIGVCYIAGDDDAKFKAIAERLATLPAAQPDINGHQALSVVVVPDASHNVVAQAPSATASVVTSFLSHHRGDLPRFRPSCAVDHVQRLVSLADADPRAASVSKLANSSIIITGYALCPYKLPLRLPLPASKLCTLTEREGAVLLLSASTLTESENSPGKGGGHGERDAGGTARPTGQEDHGLTTINASLLVGIGDVCPLPGRHIESLAESIDQLASITATLVGKRLSLSPAGFAVSLADLAGSQALCTSARCALEMALIHLASRASGESIASILADDCRSGVYISHSHLRLNGLASLAEAEQNGAAPTKGSTNQYRVLKLKVGSPGASPADAAAEGARTGWLLARLASRGVNLRLDANRCWDWEASLAFGQALRRAAWEAEQIQLSCSPAARVGHAFNAADAKVATCTSARVAEPKNRAAALAALEYVEEALLPGMSQRLPEWSEATGLPFALDETAEEEDLVADGSLEALVSSDWCAALVLKPTLVGGIAATTRLARLAASRNTKIVLTAAFESGVAHAHLAQYCHALGRSPSFSDGREGASEQIDVDRSLETDGWPVQTGRAATERGVAAAAVAHGLATFERLATDVLVPPFASLVRGDLVDLDGASRALNLTADALWKDAVGKRRVVVGKHAS